MRVAVLTHADVLVGGAETYIDTVLPRLARRGHELALCTEVSGDPGGRRLASAAVGRRIPIGSDAGACVDRLGAWSPDVAFLHGLDDVGIERAVASRWPSVFFAHTYHGTCISGSKTHSFPVVTPCTQTFGPGCLLRYLPRRCGGLSPVSMWAAYQRQQDRRSVLPSYTRVMTLSHHMRAEYIRHGVRTADCHVLPHFAPTPGHARSLPAPPSPLRLLFAGRMERLKGTHLFIDALPMVAERLGRPVEATLAGDGRRRPDLERQAAAAGRHDVRVHFTGWLDRSAVALVLAEADLLVLPSLWPEPFGLIGPEAGALGIPAAAFDVGGVSEWLVDGETGRLGGEPHTAQSLAGAVVDCVEDPVRYRRLSEGALALAAHRTLDAHVDALESHLAAVAHAGLVPETTVAS